MTSPQIQIAVDADDPHALCRFWAAALDYEIEDVDAQIGQLLEAGVLPADEVIELDGRRAFRVASASRHRDALGATRMWDGEQGPHRWVTLADPEGNEFCVG